MRQIIRQLQTTPLVQIACDRAGVPRATYYRWRTNDIVFSRAADHALEAGRFLVNDMAESQLIRKVKNGDGSSMRYWLSHNHPRYSKKYIHEHCHICETQSIEEKHRERRRTMRNYEAVEKGLWRQTKNMDDDNENKANRAEDWMFERFEMLDDEIQVENTEEKS